MKVCNPKSRYHLSIKRNYKVLEVGPGNYPHPRSNVLVEKFLDINYHRSGDVRVLKNQRLIAAEGEDLPFSDNSFDYTICSHVLEHVEDPVRFISEQTRVSPRGYIETPSIIGEYLMPKESHKWVLLEIDDKIVMYEKSKIGFNTCPDLGYLFLDYLPTTSIGYKILQRTNFGLTNVSYEWRENVDLLINPDSSYYMDFFTKPVGEIFCNKIFSKRSIADEAKMALWAVSDIFKYAFKSKILKIKS
ncbi:class I SAM-dependent methyltransferase [Dyadobacter psychrotolerans]|uniref:Class I SAM-dependent methyltransferase n=1 Tax=Dyadobacter psychrotolerans TaxID=2541721 RepID=A0A4R5DSM3_9BACT|nr:class I SAM-dependent methyltransferase [Dyadobacter psychrotolerans]TDE15270.1 class I SAM-dependent methyltransferase [Dyadobacter psychrotolerans]